MLFEVATAKPLAEIETGLREAAARHRFGIVATHDLKQTMAAKGVEFGGECIIFEVCNPHQAKKVLEANGAVSTALPCRIAVYRQAEVYKIATLLPTELMKLFGDASLEPVAREVEEVLTAMIREAA